MKHAWLLFALLPVWTMVLSGCEVIGDIFKAGVWVGVVLVLAVIGIIGWVISKAWS